MVNEKGFIIKYVRSFCAYHLPSRYAIYKNTLLKPEKLLNANDENLRIASITNLKEFYLTLGRK